MRVFPRVLLASAASLIAGVAWPQTPAPAAGSTGSGRVAFDPIGDPSDIFESRKTRSGTAAEQQKTVIPPLPAKRGERPQNLQAQAEQLRLNGSYREAEALQKRIVETVQKPGASQLESADALHRLARIEAGLLNYKGAEAHLRKALAILEKASGPERPDTLRILNMLASVLIEQKRNADAEPLAKRVLAAREKTLGAEHPDLAESLDTLGALYIESGEFAEAEAPLTRALAIREKALGPEHRDLAASIARLASLRIKQEQIADAEPLAQRALAMREKVLGPDHPDTAFSLERLAAVYVNKKQYDNVEKLGQRSLAIREKVFGPDHPATLEHVNRMGALFLLSRQFDNAESYITRALESRQRALGPEHPDVADSLELLASLYFSRGRQPEMEGLYQRALAIREKAFGPEDPRLADGLVWLGRSAKDRLAGEALTKRALAIQLKAYGSSHPETAETYTALMKLYQEQERFAEANELVATLLAGVEARDGKDGPELVKLLDALAEFYAPMFGSGSNPRFADAEPLLRRALAIEERTLGPVHPKILERLGRLATLSLELKKPGEAEQFLKRALDIAERTTAVEEGTTAFAAASLADFYRNEKRMAEAEQFYLRYVSLCQQMLFKKTRVFDLGSRLRELADIYKSQNRLSEMEGIYKKFVSLNENREEGDRDPIYFSILADFYAEQNRYAEAEALYLRELGLQEKHFASGDRKASVYRSLQSLRDIYTKTHREAEAEALLKRTLAAREKLLGPESPEILELLYQLRSFYGLAGEKYDSDNEAVIKRVVALVEKTKGPASIDLATELVTLGRFYIDADRDSEAEPVLKRAVAISEGDAKSADSLEEALDKLASLYVKQERHAEAEPILQRQLAFAEEKFGRKHSAIIPMLVQLADTQAKQGNAAPAAEVLKRAVAIENKALYAGVSMVSASKAVEALNRLYETQNRHAEREELLKDRLAIEETALKAGTITRLSAIHALSLFYRERERDGDREAILKRGIALMEKVFGPEGEGTVSSIDSLATVYDQDGRDAEASVLIERLARIAEKANGAEDRKTLSLRVRLAGSYWEQGRIGEAESIYKDVLAVNEKIAGPDPLWFSFYESAFDGLERLYKGLGRTGELEPFYQRAVAVIESKALAPVGRNVSETYAKAVEFLQGRTRYSDAMRLAERWLALKQAEGVEEGGLLAPLNAVGSLYQRQARYPQAEPHLKQALAIAQSVEGPESAKVVDAMLALAALYRIQGRYAEAEPLNERALAIDEANYAKQQVKGKNASRYGVLSPQGRIADSLNALALLRDNQGRTSEAEETLKRAIDLHERQFGRFSNRIMLQNLGGLYIQLGRYAEAEPILTLTLKTNEERLGGEHPGVAVSMLKLGQLYLSQGRYDPAEPLLLRAAAISEKVNGPAHPTTLVMLSAIAELRRGQKRHGDAEPLIKRVLAGKEQAFGPDHEETIWALQNLFRLYIEQDRRSDAEALAPRIKAMVEKAFAPDQKATAYYDFLLSRLEEKRGNWSETWRLRKHGVDILIAEARKQNAGLPGSRSEQGASDIQMSASGMLSLIQSAAQLSRQEPARMPELSSESFEMVQWSRQSQAASALAQTAARFAKGDDELAGLVRKRQDLTAQFKAIDGDLLANLTRNEESSEAWKQRRNQQEEIWRERKRIDAAVQQIDATLKVKFPDYAALANPEPLSLAQTKALLRPQEALYQIAFDDEAAYVWVVTNETMRWQTLPVGRESIAELVAALRCGLDSGAWENGRGAPARLPGQKECWQLVGETSAGGPLPFDLARAHELYKILLAPFEDMIRDKHLLVVPPGALAALPLQVLVTEAPDPSLKGSARYQQAAWLANRQAVTVLPSVASLKALRSSARKPAEQPYSGFGNPLLVGYDGNDRSAWERTDCPVSTLARLRDGMITGALAMASSLPIRPRGGVQSFYRGGLGNVALIRRQPPLPETTDELCSVSEALGGKREDVYLGARASETMLKALSRDGRLASSRVVHFATHGLIGGETEILTRSRLEPALILTPPEQPSEEDDGLLTASEAAQLYLNADIVILSACNTAAGDGKAGEALSGLARAFLYAGSRSLLASHWYVNSEGAVELVTGMFAEIARTPSIGRAEALRRTMASRIRAGGSRAHPSYWAPFVMVGEGG